MEERLRAQDVEYRGQCEELRVKVQQILKDRDAQMREKARTGVTFKSGLCVILLLGSLHEHTNDGMQVAMHAREWQEKVAGKGSRNDKQQQPPQRQQQPPRPTGRRPVAGGRPAEKHQPAFAPYPQQPPPAWEHQAGDAAYHPNQPQPQQQRPQRRGAGPVGREGEGRYPAPGMSRRERV